LKKKIQENLKTDRVFHRFGQAKVGYGGYARA